jgi:hypothetical protein
VNRTARKERHYFEMFSRNFPLPSGVVEYGDKPDVVLRGDRAIGIEITNFFLEPGDSFKSEQRQRLKRNAVVSEAQGIFQKQTAKRVEFTFGFNKDRPIKNAKHWQTELWLWQRSLFRERQARFRRQHSGRFLSCLTCI